MANYRKKKNELSDYKKNILPVMIGTSTYGIVVSIVIIGSMFMCKKIVTNYVEIIFLFLLISTFINLILIFIIVS